MRDLQNLLKFLIQSPIDFVIVGGFAAVLHGCHQTTQDVDICLAFSADQIQELRDILAPLNPRLRTKPDKPSFLTFPETLDGISSLHLETDLGFLDIISHVEGVGGYYDILKNAEEIEMFQGKCYVISIEDLIKCKKALGRYRDLAVVEELESILKERNA